MMGLQLLSPVIEGFHQLQRVLPSFSVLPLQNFVQLTAAKTICFLFTPACVYPVYMNGNLICILRRVGVDRDLFHFSFSWSRYPADVNTSALASSSNCSSYCLV